MYWLSMWLIEFHTAPNSSNRRGRPWATVGVRQEEDALF